MIAVSKFLIACAMFDSTIALPLAVNSRESRLARSRARSLQPLLTDIVALREDINSISALSRRSTKSIETPDPMWNGGDRIRRSEESIRSLEAMWDPLDDDSLRLSK